MDARRLRRDVVLASRGIHHARLAHDQAERWVAEHSHAAGFRHRRRAVRIYRRPYRTSTRADAEYPHLFDLLLCEWIGKLRPRARRHSLLARARNGRGVEYR